MFHCALILGANHLKFLGSWNNKLEFAFHHHKAEVIRIINERLGDPIMSKSDGTVASVAAMTLLEVGGVTHRHLCRVKND